MGDQLFRHFPEDSEEEEADKCLSWDTIKEGSLKRKSLKHNGVAVSVCVLSLVELVEQTILTIHLNSPYCHSCP